MRFKIILKRLTKPCHMPLSYQSQLTAAIYRILQKIDPTYSNFLHNTGYQSGNKRFKYFTFSNFQIPQNQWEIDHDTKRLFIYSDTITFIVSFWIDKAMETFIRGLFEDQRIVIADKLAHNVFEVIRVEAISDRIIHTTQAFRTLSPLVIAKKQDNGKNADYLSPQDAEYAEIFFNNLISKYTAYVLSTDANAQKPQNNAEQHFEILNSSPLKSKLITIKKDSAKEIKVRGYNFDFKLTAPIELLEIGYFGGFGSNNAQGFGCARLLAT